MGNKLSGRMRGSLKSIIGTWSTSRGSLQDYYRDLHCSKSDPEEVTLPANFAAATKQQKPMYIFKHRATKWGT